MKEAVKHLLKATKPEAILEISCCRVHQAEAAMRWSVQLLFMETKRLEVGRFWVIIID